jgi:hypothetical protein
MPEALAQGADAQIAVERLIVIQSGEWILSELAADPKLSSSRGGISPARSAALRSTSELPVMQD